MFCPSNHMGKFISGVFRFFAMVRHLLFLSCGILLQKSNFAVLHQLVHQCHPFFQITHRQHICHIFDMAVHLAGFHKTVIQSIFRCLGSIAHFPIFQQMQIIRQHPEAQHFILPELTDIGTLRLDHSCGSGRFRVKPEVQSQLLRCFITAQIEQPCHKVDHIPFGSAAEAEKIVLIQLQARMPVVVERAASHAVVAHFQPVVFGGLLDADCRLDGFIDCHRKPSVHNILESTKHPP